MHCKSGLLLLATTVRMRRLLMPIQILLGQKRLAAQITGQHILSTDMGLPFVLGYIGFQAKYLRALVT